MGLDELKNVSRGRIYSQAGNKLGASSFLARNDLFTAFSYTSCLAVNELVPKLTKNTASDLIRALKKQIWMRVGHHSWRLVDIMFVTVGQIYFAKMLVR
jgi:hypothetical protein